MPSNHTAIIQRAKIALEGVLAKQPTLTEEEAIVELFLVARSVARLTNASYLRISQGRG